MGTYIICGILVIVVVAALLDQKSISREKADAAAEAAM